MNDERRGLVLASIVGTPVPVMGDVLADVRPSMPGAPGVTPEALALQHINIQRGRVLLNVHVLKSLRAAKLQSQDEMATACVEGRFRVSIASIKRAETGKPVMFRVARELARYFGVPVQLILLPTIDEYRPPQFVGN